jgi:glycogen operon protein
VFRREHFLAGESTEMGLPDAWWFRTDGRRMTRRDWENPEHRWLGVFLNGGATNTRDRRGQPVTGDSFLVLFNSHHEDVVFQLPAARFGARWTVELTTALPERQAGSEDYRARRDCYVSARSITVLRRAS